MEGTDATSGERTFAGSQRLDFQPGEKVDFRFEAAELGELKRIRLRLAPPPNLTHNMFQAALADLKGESRPVSHGGHAGEPGAQPDGMGYLRRWHLSHAMVTNGKTMQMWTFPVDQTVTEDPVLEVGVLDGLPTFQRTVIEELYQNERRLTQFSRFSTKQMFPNDRAPWADGKNRPQYKEGVQLPDAGGVSWRWDGDWDVDISADTDQEGWQYGFAWSAAMGPECTAACFVRRRRWVRVRRRVED